MTPLQHAKPQREDDGSGALQRVAVVDGDGAARPISAASVRADSVSALESRTVSPPEASWRAMTDPIPPVPIDRGGHDRNLFAGDLGVHSDSSAGVLTGQRDQSPCGSVVCPTSIR
jgi:hypothetical protein